MELTESKVRMVCYDMVWYILRLWIDYLKDHKKKRRKKMRDVERRWMGKGVDEWIDEGMEG